MHIISEKFTWTFFKTPNTICICSLCHPGIIVWFQKISIPLPRMVLPIRPPHPLGISVPEGSCITPHPPGISYFPFRGLYLPHLEIVERVPRKINCSHLKTQFFIIFNLFLIFYKAICILTQVEHA